MLTALPTKALSKKSRVIHPLCSAIVIMMTCATFACIIHFDDGLHDVHPLEHSAICKWVKDGKLCRNSLSLPSLLCIPALVLFLLLTGLSVCRPKTAPKPVKKLLLTSRRKSRAPPL